MHQQFVSDLLSARLSARVSKLVKIFEEGSGRASYKAITDKGSFFIKLNDADRTEAEVKGLQQLASTNSVDVAKIMDHGHATGKSFLILEWLESTARKQDYWLELGKKIALLHANTFEKYGLDHSNFIGILPQLNTFKTTWIDFFIECRLIPQIKLASNQLSSKDHQLFEKLFPKLASLLPEDKPSLLHGDLWSGNVLINNKGEACVIDPAVYFGNREIEIAFTYLFGGFEEDFYKGYNEVFPLIQDLKKRIDIYNLYPLLVHLNMFGGSYIHSIRNTLLKYTG